MTETFQRQIYCQMVSYQLLRAWTMENEVMLGEFLVGLGPKGHKWLTQSVRTHQVEMTKNFEANLLLVGFIQATLSVDKGKYGHLECILGWFAVLRGAPQLHRWLTLSVRIQTGQMEMTDLLETNLLLGTLILPKGKNDKKKKTAKENVQKLQQMTQSQVLVTYAAHTSGNHRNNSLW